MPFWRKKNDFIGFAIFSIGGHLGFSTNLNFIILKPYIVWSCCMRNLRTMGAVVSEMDLKARVEVNFARVDVNFQTVIVT